jgi:hypothetical protein
MLEVLTNTRETGEPDDEKVRKLLGVDSGSKSAILDGNTTPRKPTKLGGTFSGNHQ